jgi:hypothetical protein
VQLFSPQKSFFDWIAAQNGSQPWIYLQFIRRSSRGCHYVLEEGLISYFLKVLYYVEKLMVDA